jgi:hypothetical protein
LVAALVIALPLTACGGGATNNPGDAGASGATTAAGGLSMTVAQPASGASVSAPFDVRINSSVPLGATTTGMHHVHIWFDGEQSKYTVVESDTTQIKTVAAGSHTMHVSLRNANHSAAGVEVEVPIMVTGAGGGSGATTTPGTTSSPYGY